MFINHINTILLVIIIFQLNSILFYATYHNDKNIILQDTNLPIKQLKINTLDNYKYNNYKEYQNTRYKYKTDVNTEKLWIHPLFNLMNHIVIAVYLLVMEYFKVFQYCFCFTLIILVKLIEGYYHLLELLFEDILQYPTICYSIIGMFLALYQCNIIIKTILHAINEKYILKEHLINNNGNINAKINENINSNNEDNKKGNEKGNDNKNKNNDN